MKINLGCGQDYRDGWENWDISKHIKAEKYLDIRTDIFPANDNSVECIYCSGVLEQILANEHLIHALNECWRILIPSGHLTIVVPNSRYSITFQDPHDCRHFLPETFKYFDFKDICYQRFGSIYGYMPWDVMSIEENQQHIMTIKMQKHDF